MVERTFAMIKPDAVKAHHIGKIIDRAERANFIVRGLRMEQLTKEKAEKFYAVHKERPFFAELVTFVISGPVVVMVLEKEDGVKIWRDMMGSTDPRLALQGTIRKDFGTSIGMNAVHGSDALDTARQELALFFPELK